MRHRLMCLVLLLAVPAFAQEDAPSVSPSEREPTSSWTISFEPRLWYGGPSGDITFPGGTIADEKITLDDLNMDSPRASPYGEFRVQRGRLRFAFAGSAFSADKRSTVLRTETLGSVPVFAGETASFGFSSWTAEARALYEVYSYIDGSTTDGRDVLRFRTLLGGGLRASSVDLDLAVAPTSGLRTGLEPTSLAYDGTFAEPILAAAVEMDLYERFMFSVNASGGAFGTGDRSSSSFSIEPALAWHPQPNIGLEIGFRIHVYRLKDGNEPSQFEWSGSMAGLYGGLSLRF